MASDGRPDCSCCSHGSAAPHSVLQTLDEMDFERGIWSAAVDGDLDRVRTFLLKGTDPNTVDRAGYTALQALAPVLNRDVYLCSEEQNENKLKIFLLLWRLKVEQAPSGY